MNTPPTNTPSTDRTWEEVFDDLLDIRALKDNWDGEGSPAADPELVDAALTLAKRLRDSGEDAPDRVHLGVNGTIFFESYADRGYTEVEICSPDKVERRFVAAESGVTESAPLVKQA